MVLQKPLISISELTIVWCYKNNMNNYSKGEGISPLEEFLKPSISLLYQHFSKLYFDTRVHNTFKNNS